MASPSYSPHRKRSSEWLERVETLLRGAGLAQAGEAALQALAEGVEDAALLNIAAAAHHRAGRFEEAVDLLQRARKLAPRDARVANSLGVCLRALGRADEALKAYDAAIRADPGLAAAHCNRGTVLRERNDITGARSAYERAAQLDPAYAEPLAALASLDAQAGDTASARDRAERALALAPGNHQAEIALASSDLQAGDRASATTRIARLQKDPSLGPVNRALVFGLAGDLLDAEAMPAEAFRAYAAGNELLRQLHAPRFAAPGGTSALDQLRMLETWFAAADPADWRAGPQPRPRAADPTAHVFLVGFPRSGTTLLENVLAAHPEVTSMEEKDCLAALAAPFVTSPEGLTRLERLGGGEAAKLRETYWACVAGHGIKPKGKVFIDKMPLSSALLPVIARLFPKARILFARRDPRDVVLSCFRRRFGMNAAMYQLLTLEGAAAYYDSVMRLAETYARLLDLPLHEVRYEALVEDFDGTARAACAFLGLEWREELREFADRARSRGIATPSAAQVARGLNRDGQGVWRRYAAEMAPVLPMLQPWVERFGYDPASSA